MTDDLQESNQVLEAPLEAAPNLEAADNESIASSAPLSTASLSESIFDYRKLHGRTFQKSKAGDYWAPNDEHQNEGLDLLHHCVTMVMGNKLVLAPIGDNVRQVLDVGTGTGIWACDFADEHPDAEVIGTDISPIQPSFVPPNVRFLIDDCLLDWTWPENYFDLVHIRSMYGSVPNFVDLYKKALKHLKPGGWIQCTEVDILMQSDHVDIPNDHVFNTWANLFREGGEKTGRSFDVAEGHTMMEYVKKAGFVDVVEKKMKTPSHGWAKDPHYQQIGFLAQVAMDQSLEGFALFMATEVLGWSREATLLFVALVRKETRKLSNCNWFWTTVVYARKPLQNEPTQAAWTEAATGGGPTNTVEAAMGPEGSTDAAGRP